MKEMIIKIAPFVLKQTVYTIDRETNEVKEDKIPQKDLAKYFSAHQNEIDCIHIFGKKEFVEKIHEECITKYNINKCNFKINE